MVINLLLSPWVKAPPLLPKWFSSAAPPYVGSDSDRDKVVCLPIKVFQSHFTMILFKGKDIDDQYSLRLVALNLCEGTDAKQHTSLLVDVEKDS